VLWWWRRSNPRLSKPSSSEESTVMLVSIQPGGSTAQSAPGTGYHVVTFYKCANVEMKAYISHY